MPETLLSIGEVINLLRDEYPDISVSKIRFLEAQGLISPTRSDSGYRLFGTDDLRRLRYVLSLQRDHFLPLKVIKSKLTLWERGEEADGQEGRPDRHESEGEPLNRSDLLRRSGLTELQLGALLSHGIISPEDGDDVFPAWALGAAIEARRLLQNGLEPRHLRAVRLAAEREAELLRQLTNPLFRHQNAEARTRARQVLTGTTEAVQVLHRLLLNALVNDLYDE